MAVIGFANEKFIRKCEAARTAPGIQGVEARLLAALLAPIEQAYTHEVSLGTDPELFHDAFANLIANTLAATLSAAPDRALAVDTFLTMLKARLAELSEAGSDNRKI